MGKIRARPRTNIPSSGKQEIKRQCVELNQEFIDDCEYAMAWVLHKSDKTKFGIKRLLDFREDFRAEIKRMIEFYMTDDIYPAKVALRELGYDVEKLNAKDEENGK